MAASKNDSFNTNKTQKNATFISNEGFKGIKKLDSKHKNNVDQRRQDTRNSLLSCLDSEYDKDFLDFLNGAPQPGGGTRGFKDATTTRSRNSTKGLLQHYSMLLL
jgi:hypothetical protein